MYIILVLDGIILLIDEFYNVNFVLMVLVLWILVGCKVNCFM